MDAATPAYDRERHKWIGQCPHGDWCTRCDAIGYCEREEGDAARPAKELAADVRRGIENKRLDWSGVVKAKRALDALVAQIADLEAQVAALTQERDIWSRDAERMYAVAEVRYEQVGKAKARAEAAEAALAATRQALAAYRSALRSGEPETVQLREHGDRALAEPA